MAVALDRAERAEISGNPWQGENLAGKHIYVQAEQGFGDTLQFARYMPLLTARGAKVTLRVHQQLVTLMRESLPDITVLGDRGDPAPYQCDAVLLEPAARLQNAAGNHSGAGALSARAGRSRNSAGMTRLGKMKGLRIGIVWAGNPEHVNDTRRSIDLTEACAAVRRARHELRQPAIRPARGRSEKTETQARRSRILPAAFEDFVDTAAAIDALDLVITVDTSVAHVAGALGKPVWVLLPWVTDWRWLLNREDNPWYPTMRLFRQKRGEDWPTSSRASQAN